MNTYDQLMGSANPGKNSASGSPGDVTPRVLLGTVDEQMAGTEGLRARLARPNMPAAREAAQLFQGCFRALATRTHLPGEVAVAVERRALLRSSDAFLALRAGERLLASSALLELWITGCSVELRRQEPERQAGELIEALEGAHTPFEHSPKGSHVAEISACRPAFESDFEEWGLLYHQAIEQVVTRAGTEPVRTALRALMTRLELSQDDTGRMFGVSGETVRRWERGATSIPAERRTAILAAEAGLRRLQELFRPHRLPTVVRRAAELFDGESALDWILRGRIADVADRYETALVYQA